MPFVAALAAPEIILAALLGLLLLYSTRSVWVPFLIWLLSQIPVIGNWVAGNAARLLEDAFNWLGNRVHDMVQVLTDAVIRLVTRSIAAAVAVHAALASAVNAAAHVVTVLLPWAWAQTQALVNGLRAWVMAEVQRLEGLIDWRVRAAVALLLAALESAVSAAVANFNQQFKGLEDRIGLLWATVTAAIGAALNAAQAYTDQRVHGAETSAAAAVAGASAEAQAAEQALRDKIEQAARDAETFAQTLTLGAERAFGLANARTLATALAATGAVAIGLEAIRELECIKRCNTLGQLGNELELLDIAALMGLVALVAHDPRGAERLVQDAVGPIVTEGAAVFCGIVGR
jgi:hypothetical protein